MTRSALASLLCALLGACPALAEDGPLLTGTLAKIHDRGTILVGRRENTVPFSFANRAGQPVGFSIDLCHGIAADVAAALQRDLVEADAPNWQSGIRIVYVPVAADARLPLMTSGAIDLECGSTTANEERARTVAFSPVFFLAGTKLLVPAGSAVSSYHDLAGKTVAVGAGTTNLPVIQRLAATTQPAFKVAEFPSVDAGFAALASGQADALASDDILLAGEVLAHSTAETFTIVGDYLSFEPYAIMLRRDDPDFAAVVRQSFARMAELGTLRTLYNRWFTEKLPGGGPSLNLPMSAHLAEMYRALGQPD